MVFFPYFDFISESLFTHGLSVPAATSGYGFAIGLSIDLYTTYGILGRGLSSEAGELSSPLHETEVHFQLPIGTSSCRCVPTSTRLVSLVHDQLTKKAWKWIPWKYRISLTRSEEISGNRAQKMPKLDNFGLQALLFDDPPSLDISNNSMGVNSIRNMLEVHDRAIAFCQGAHLANLKAYTHKFLGFLTTKYDGDLRNPTVMEAQSADQKIWTVIAELMEKGWSMDDCLHEMTNLRHDLPGLLQPRPRVLRPLQSPSSQPSTPRPDGQKGKGQGKSKGKYNAGKSKGRIQWITEIQRDGNFKQICMKFQTGKCQNSSCAFQHVCAYPLDGKACGKNHGAMSHVATPH